MINVTIDTLEGIDISKLSYENIACRHGTGRSIIIGNKMEGRKLRKEYAYRRGVQTAIGDIEENVWRKLAEALIKQTGETEFFNRFCKYLEHSRPNHSRTPQEKRHYALELFIARIYDNLKWVDFIPFNRIYRPDVLAQADLIWVITECCQTPGEITRQLYDANRQIYSERVTCPQCGRMSVYKRCKPPKSRKTTENGKESEEFLGNQK